MNVYRILPLPGNPFEIVSSTSKMSELLQLLAEVNPELALGDTVHKYMANNTELKNDSVIPSNASNIIIVINYHVNAGSDTEPEVAQPVSNVTFTNHSDFVDPYSPVEIVYNGACISFCGELDSFIISSSLTELRDIPDSRWIINGNIPFHTVSDTPAALVCENNRIVITTLPMESQNNTNGTASTVSDHLVTEATDRIIALIVSDLEDIAHNTLHPDVVKSFGDKLRSRLQ